MSGYRTLAERAVSDAKRKATASKPGEPFEVMTPEGPVTLTKQPMEWVYPLGWDYDYRKRQIENAEKRGEIAEAMPQPAPGLGDGPKFKSKYKVEFEGVVRAYIVALNGWGKPWVLYRAVRENTAYYAEHAQENWWLHYMGANIIGDLPPCAAVREGKGGRDALAALVPTLVRGGELPTLQEAKQKIVEVREAQRQKRRADAASSAQAHKETAERMDEDAARFTDEADALEAIADQHRVALSNFQLSTLMAVVERKRIDASAATARAQDHRARMEKVEKEAA